MEQAAEHNGALTVRKAAVRMDVPEKTLRRVLTEPEIARRLIGSGSEALLPPDLVEDLERRLRWEQIGSGTAESE